jgi:hypothetical protein
VTNTLKCPWTVDPSNTILWWPHWLMYVNTILSFVHRLTFCVGSYSAMKKIDVAFPLLCNIMIKIVLWSFFNIYAIIYYVYFIITVNTYLFKYVPVKRGFIILSIIGVLRIPEEFYLYKDKDKVTENFNNPWIIVLLINYFVIQK